VANPLRIRPNFTHGADCNSASGDHQPPAFWFARSATRDLATITLMLDDVDSMIIECELYRTRAR
jgi:hypothetical protein